MLQRDHRDAVAALTMFAQGVRQLVRIEALDEHRAALHVERRPVLLRVTDHVAQHADEAVGARGQHEHEPQRRWRERRIEFGPRQVVELARGFEHALHRGIAHAGQAVEHAVDGGGGHLRCTRDVHHARAPGIGRG